VWRHPQVDFHWGLGVSYSAEVGRVDTDACGETGGLEGAGVVGL